MGEGEEVGVGDGWGGVDVDEVVEGVAPRGGRLEGEGREERGVVEGVARGVGRREEKVGGVEEEREAER